MESRRIVGDCREVLRTLIAEGVKVQMCVTSPPYWGLRDYGTATWEGGDGSECDHITSQRGPGGLAAAAERADGKPRNPENRRDKGGEHYAHYRHTCAKCGARRVDEQIGLESTPEEYLATMVEVFRLVREVLADDGTIWVNMGDSYASSGDRVHGGFNGSTEEPQRVKGQRLGSRMELAGSGLKPKDLVGMPWRLALALQADGWYLRSDIIWNKPNPMPESCTDRPTKAHEYLFLLTKRSSYFYDAEALREPHCDTAGPSSRFGNETWEARDVKGTLSRGSMQVKPGGRQYNPAGRNRRTVWTIATEAFSDAHFATFPKKLVEPCIMAGTSERGHCPECGARWERVVESEIVGSPRNEVGHYYKHAGGDGTCSFLSKTAVHGTRVSRTLDWRPTCTCDLAPVPDMVLDPFLGSGTVAEVAEHLGRGWIGIDLNPEYAKMQKARTAQTGMAL